MTPLDLFGCEITTPAPVAPGVPQKRKTKPNGYAALPGTGPAGETCKTCAFYSGVRYAKKYRKCLLMLPQWTGGPGTDILARSPACAYWRKESIPCPDCEGHGYRRKEPAINKWGGRPPCKTCATTGVVRPNVANTPS